RECRSRRRPLQQGHVLMRLFDWLFGRRAFGEYPRRERTIFRYWDGTRQRLGDPLAIHRQLLEVPGLEETAKVGEVPTVEGVKARGELAAAVRQAFGIAPLEAGGLLESECLDLFVRFGE